MIVTLSSCPKHKTRFMNFAFGFTEVAVMVSIFITYNGALGAGGPSGVIWCFLVNWALTTVVSYSMAEICSAYPSAGSVYHWAGQLVPQRLTPIMSYIVRANRLNTFQTNI